MPDHETDTNTSDLVAECEVLRERVLALEEELSEHRAERAAVADALVRATRYGAAVREEARAEAELALQKATAVAEKRSAIAERERVIAERELAELRRITQHTRSGLETLLSQTIESLHAPLPPAPGELNESLKEGIEAATVDDGAGMFSERPWHAS